MLSLSVPSIDGPQSVNVIRKRIVMNNLTNNNLKNIWNGQKNLIGKPIFIDFYGDW